MYSQNINWNQIINYQIKSNTCLKLTNFDSSEVDRIIEIIDNNRFKNFIYRKDIQIDKSLIILDFKSDEKANSVKLIWEKEINNILVDLKVNNHIPQDSTNILSFDLGKKYIRVAKSKNEIKNNSKKYLKEEFPSLGKSKKVFNPISESIINNNNDLYNFYEKNKDKINISKGLIKYEKIPIISKNRLDIEYFVNGEIYEFEERKVRKSSNYSGKSMKRKNR